MKKLLGDAEKAFEETPKVECKNFVKFRADMKKAGIKVHE
jgi:hypothetical protein